MIKKLLTIFVVLTTLSSIYVLNKHETTKPIEPTVVSEAPLTDKNLSIEKIRNETTQAPTIPAQENLKSAYYEAVISSKNLQNTHTNNKTNTIQVNFLIKESGKTMTQREYTVFVYPPNNAHFSEPAIITAHWKNYGYIDSIDWQSLHKEHPYRQIEDILWTMSSHLNGELIIKKDNFNGQMTYRYWENQQEKTIERQLVTSDPEIDKLEENWQLNTTNPQKLTAVSDVTLYSKLETKLPISDQGNAAIQVEHTLHITKKATPKHLANSDIADNELVNLEWQMTRQTMFDKDGSDIRTPEDLKLALANFERTRDLNLLNGIGSYVVNTLDDVTLKALLSSGDISEQFKADLIHAIERYPSHASESLLADIATASDTHPDNALRAVVGLGALDTPSGNAQQVLANIALNTSDIDPAVKYNALIQMGRLYPKLDTGYQTTIDSQISQFSQQPNTPDEVILMAKTATESDQYIPDAIEALTPHTNHTTETRAAAAMLIAHAAQRENPQATDTLETFILEETNLNVLTNLSNGYKNQEITNELQTQLQTRAITTPVPAVRSVIITMLSENQTRCRSNQAFFSDALASDAVDDNLKQIIRINCHDS